MVGVTTRLAGLATLTLRDVESGILMAEKDNPAALSAEEQELLEVHMDFYRALETGQRRPTTPAQEHFVRVTQGRAVAETTHERAYVKHMRLRAEQREANRRASSQPHPYDAADAPTSEWFSRDDWRKSRGRQRNDMRWD